MQQEPITYDLPEVLRTEESIALHEFLTDHNEQPVILQGGAVRKIGGQAAQVILAHRIARQAHSISLDVHDPSDALVGALRVLDLSDLLEPAV